MGELTNVMRHRKPQIQDSDIPVHWAATGNHVFQTSLQDFEKAVKIAKENRSHHFEVK